MSTLPSLAARVASLSEAQRRALADRIPWSAQGERLVGIIALAESATAPSEEELRAHLAARLPEYMIPSRFVVVDRLPRTAAGKLDRRALAQSKGGELQAPHAGTASPPAQPSPMSEVEVKLVSIWRDVLKVDDVGLDDDFFEIGGDSLLSIRVISRAGREGIRIAPERFFERPTVRHMASIAGAEQRSPRPVATPVSGAIGDAPLTPIQHWFLDALPEHRDWWNQSYVLELGAPLGGDTLRAIVRTLVDHHPALRLRLVQRDGGWRQEFPPAGGDAPFRVVSLADAEAARYIERLDEEADREHASLRLDEGRLFRVTLFEGEDGWRRLLLLGHHVVLDGVSWNVILEDLATLVTQATRSEPLRLTEPRGATSPRAWAHALVARAFDPALAASAQHWLSLPADDRPHTTSTHGDGAERLVRLGREETQRLVHDAARRLDVSVQSLLLSALLVAWRDWTGDEALTLDLEGHGRDTVGDSTDVTRTVGWFTTVFPVQLSLPDASGDSDESAAIARATQQSLDALPQRGAAHGLLRYLAPDEQLRAKLAARPRSPLLFNYLGALDFTLPDASRLRVTGEPSGRARHPLGARPYPLELNARIEDGDFVLSIGYARTLHDADAIDRLASLFCDALLQLAETNAGIEASFALSPMQELMLLSAISDEGGGVLLNQLTYEIRGPLDVEAFRHAWRGLVRRHAALRTSFRWEGVARPVQLVHADATLDVRVVDLSSLSAPDQGHELEALRRTDASTPFAVDAAPLMRCTLVRHAPDRHTLLWAIHHLVVDRWSHAILFADLRASYEAARSGEAVELPPAPRFEDYVRWVARQDRAAAERFWRTELDGVRETTSLAMPTTARAPSGRASTTHSLTEQTSGAVRAVAAKWRVAPGSVLQGAIALLLARRNGRSDVTYSLTVSGRPPELADATSCVGSFVNNVPARVRLSAEQSIESLVRELHRAEGRRIPYSYVSPVDVQGWSALPPGRPLHDTLVLLNLANDADIEWAGLDVSAQSATLDASYPFVLAAGTDGDRLAFTLVHDADFAEAELVLGELAELVERVSSADDRATVGALVTIDEPSIAADPVVVSSGNGAHQRALPGDALTRTLLESWREILGVSDVGLDDDFFALGGTSLQAAQLFARIERIAGRTLPLSTLVTAGSVRALLAELDRPVRRRSAMVHLRSSGIRPTVYAVPGIGGNVVGLAGLARQLGPDTPFAAFESPGLDGSETPLATIEAIAERYVSELMCERDGEYHLVGICWGAAVAFEMAHRLRALGRPPTTVALMDPAVLLRETAAQATASDVTFVRNRLELYWDEFRAGSWRDRTRLIASKAKRAARVLAGGTEGERSQVERHHHRVREANRLAVTRYAPEVREIGATRLFLTIDRDFDGIPDPRLEWSTLVAPAPSIARIGGVNSGDAISPAHVAGFATALRDWFESVGGG